MTIVPDIVVAERISAFKNTGMVPKTAIIIMDNRPKERVLPHFKSTANSFENDENVESRVDAADVIIMKFITKRISCYFLIRLSRKS